MKTEEIARLQAKTPEQRFKYSLQNDFEFSAKMADLLLQEARDYLIGQPETLRPGQMRVILVARKARHGRCLSATPTKEVIWTVDAGMEDLEVLQEHGPVKLRRHRLQRLLREALEQGAVATQEDLAQVLQVTTRTIKRDYAALKAAGVWLPSRGALQGIGRGQSHKAQILKRWLQGETYDQLVLHTHHSLASIQRYVQTFVRVVQLHQQGFEPSQIAMLVQIGLPLVKEYLQLWQQSDSPATRERLSEQLQRLGQAGKGYQKGGV